MSINVTSHNQQGGITAANVVVGNVSRKLTEEKGQQLLNTLRKETTIVCQFGDSEAYKLASQIKSFLDQHGYTTRGINQAVKSGAMKNGVSIYPEQNGQQEIMVWPA